MGVKISDLSPKGSKIASTDLIEVAVVSGGGYVSRSVTGSQINEVSLDTTPQLGGNLDVNGFSITSATNVDVVINPKGTGITKVETDLHLRDSAGSTAKQINLYEGFTNGSNYVGIKAPDTLASNTTYTLPTADGTSGQVLKTNGSGTLSWQTIPIEIQLACSDETTALSAGTAKVTFRTPCAMTVTAVRASLTTAQASGNIFTVDINEGGTSILSTKLTIDNTEKTSTTAATPAVISDSSLADDAEMTIDIDQIGDGTAKGLKVTIIGTRV